MTNEPYSNSLFFLYLITKPQESIESKLITHHFLAPALEMFVLYLYFLYAYILELVRKNKNKNQQDRKSLADSQPM